jgi:tRNA (Thr-GGU) A37 N-methylase
VADNGDNFLELDPDMFQTIAVRPIVEAARRNRKGVVFVTASPDPPNPWRLQVVALNQRSCERIRKIIAEELGSVNLKSSRETASE